MANFTNQDGVDTITGTDSGDFVDPDYNEDYEWLGAFDNDEIATGKGNDTIYVTPGTDDINGGENYDSLRVLWAPLSMWVEEDPDENIPLLVTPNNFVVDLIAGTYSIQWWTFDNEGDLETLIVTSSGVFRNIEQIWGSDRDDTIWATDANDLLYVDQGANAIHGRDGFDVLARGTYTVSSIQTEDIIVDTQAGTWVGWDGKTSTFSSIEEFRFDDGNDVFNGSSSDEVLLPGRGTGTFNGRGGRDTLNMVGSSDTGVLLNTETGKVKLKQSGDIQTFKNFEVFIGSYQNDKMIGSDLDEVFSAGWGDDTVEGGAGNDRLIGSRGKDALHGGEGDDELLGNDDNDRLFGDDGKDRLDGGGGNDKLTGGDDADIFVIYADGSGGQDSLMDFQFGTDTLLLI